MQLTEILYGQLMVELFTLVFFVFMFGFLLGGWLMRILTKKDIDVSYLRGKIDALTGGFTGKDPKDVKEYSSEV